MADKDEPELLVCYSLWLRGWTSRSIASMSVCSQVPTWGEGGSSFNREPRGDGAGDQLSSPLCQHQGCEPLVGCLLPLLKRAFCNSICTCSFFLRCIFSPCAVLPTAGTQQLCSSGGPGHGGTFLSSESYEQILGFKPAGRWHKQSKVFISHLFLLLSVC